VEDEDRDEDRDDCWLQQSEKLVPAGSRCEGSGWMVVPYRSHGRRGSDLD
jgi:hypothetical protein